MPPLDSELQGEVDEIEKSMNRTKLLACVLLVRNSLKQGNSEVNSTLKNSKFSKDVTFDKIYAMMITNCFEKINQDEVFEVILLIPEFLPTTYTFLDEVPTPLGTCIKTGA